MPDRLQILHEHQPSDADIKTLGRALDEFNAKEAGDDGFRRIFLSARDPSAALRGGALGATYWGWLFIELLFVDEPWRGRGVGEGLLIKMERIGIAQGAKRSFLDTFSFQAESFYLARGYTPFGELGDFPPGHRRIWLSKRLSS